MTTETNDTYDTYVVSGVGPYAYTFRIFSETDLTVTALEPGYVDPVTLSTALYTVAGVNDEDGGSITLTAGAATTYAGYTLDIRSNVPIEQPTSIKSQGTFAPIVHETAFDRLNRQIQDLARKVRASFRYPDNVSLDAAMTNRSSWLSKYLYMNSSGVIEPASSIGSTALTQSIIGETLYPPTDAENAALVTVVNYLIPSHEFVGHVIVDRYGTNTTPGTTDMSAAIIAAQKVATTGASVSGIGDHAKILFLRGVYRIETDSIFTQAYATSGFQRGLVYEGQGLESTKLLLITGGSAKYFYKNPDSGTQKYMLTTYRDLGFYTDSTTYGNGWYFYADQGFVWDRCKMTTFARVIEGNGNLTGSEQVLRDCRITDVYDRVISFNNNQMLNIMLFGCSAENIYGNVFHVASGGGGRLLVQGGSYILDDGGSKHWLLYLDGGGIGGNNDCYTFLGIQTELHSTNTGLVYKGTPSTSCVVEFLSCNQSSTLGVRDIVDITSGRVIFRGGRINTSDTYVLRTTGTITWPRAGETASIHFENVGIPKNLSTLITTDTYGFASARNCHYDEYEPSSNNSVRYAVDFDLNWNNMARGYMFPGLKTVCFKIEQGDWPYTGDGGAGEWTVTLPNNAKIKNIYVFRPANGSGGAGNVQLSVGNGDKSTTYGSSTLAAGTAEHYISVEKAHNQLISCGTTTPNTQVKLWGATTNSSIVTGGYAIVQYY